MLSDHESYSSQDSTISKNDAHLNQLAYVGQISAGIAHEVRNPLTVVKGFLQLLQEEVENKYIDIAQSELENAITTLNNLLQLSKPDSENEEQQTIHLAVELESMLNLFQDQLYRFEVVTDWQDTEITFYGRKNQLKKAFFNLIKNAIESMSEDATGKLMISHHAVNEEVIITIQDTGNGIPNDKIPLLGTPFYSTKEQGTGMGLTQVYAIVYQHGGGIEVTSSEHEGTTFKIRLPRHREHQKYERSPLEQLVYEPGMNIKQFLLKNIPLFEEQLLLEAVNVKDYIKNINKVGNINLLDNARKLVLMIIERREHELVSFAKQEGDIWARHSFTLAFKLEWFKAIRRTLWSFLYRFSLLRDHETSVDQDDFFKLEQRVNGAFDQVFTYFFLQYSKSKDEELDKKQQDLHYSSASLMPMGDGICILPLNGKISPLRLEAITKRSLLAIEHLHIQSFIVDLSNITELKKHVVHSFVQLLEGIHMMGCRIIVTGARAEVVTNLMGSKKLLHLNIEFQGTLTLDHLLTIKKESGSS